MTIVTRTTIKSEHFEVEALKFEAESPLDCCAVFSHGFTSSKNSIVSWAQRLADDGISSIVFDWPGHYLGNFKDCENFESFRQNAHLLFISAYKEVQEENSHVVLGGHSLGALLSLKASMNPIFNTVHTHNICVGLGLSESNDVHLFSSTFYQKTLNIRRQLVSPSLNPDIVFPWIKEEKKEIEIKDKSIFILNGLDDAVVGKEGGAFMKEILEKNDNNVTLSTPKNLPHHRPEMATVHIAHNVKAFLNKV